MNIKELVQNNRNGQSVGLPCFCTSNMFVIDAALGFAAQNNLPVIIEATCNQVNQFGGYTGMQPLDFASKVKKLAREKGVSEENLILGGDHLGPNPWRHLPVNEAMEHAKTMVKQYVEAGFTKIHLDASMACGDETTPSFETVAQRASELCEIAETNAPDPSKLFYIIGTEVPIPGGETEAMDGLEVTLPERLDETIETHIQAFNTSELKSALERVVSVVVQPGVDFSHTEIFPYAPEKAKTLIKQLNQHQNLTFEAHSTDYQKTEALGNLVTDHHLFLKVGPELTFALREALFLLSQLEDDLLGPKASGLISTVLDTMMKEPKDWKNYYKGDSQEEDFLRKYSYSDRIRYYWDRPNVSAAIDMMIKNLNKIELPHVLISQLFGLTPPEQNHETASSLIEQRIRYVIRRYYQACGFNA